MPMTPKAHPLSDDNRKVESEYEVYAGGGMIKHQFDERGCHRLVGWDGKPGDWTGYVHLAVLPSPSEEKYLYIGATAYGLLDNIGECVARVEVLPKK